MCDNPETSILLLKPRHSIFNLRYRMPNLSGGAPLSAKCACVYNEQKMCPFHIYIYIYLIIPCKYKLSCTKACFSSVSKTVSLSLVLYQKYTLFRYLY